MVISDVEGILHLVLLLHCFLCLISCPVQFYFSTKVQSTLLESIWQLVAVLDFRLVSNVSRMQFHLRHRVVRIHLVSVCASTQTMAVS